ncbi:hypothetical protein CSC34_3237 [Pseudomonas aeruginosa]|nr:hypothetical protein CSC34_3237 [Pseudomonas aeruginosa]
MQGLGGVDGRVGKSSKAERADQRQQPQQDFRRVHGEDEVRMEEIKLSLRLPAHARNTL